MKHFLLGVAIVGVTLAVTISLTGLAAIAMQDAGWSVGARTLVGFLIGIACSIPAMIWIAKTIAEAIVDRAFREPKGK